MNPNSIQFSRIWCNSELCKKTWTEIITDIDLMKVQVWTLPNFSYESPHWLEPLQKYDWIFF